MLKLIFKLISLRISILTFKMVEPVTTLLAVKIVTVAVITVTMSVYYYIVHRAEKNSVKTCNYSYF